MRSTAVFVQSIAFLGAIHAVLALHNANSISKHETVVVRNAQKPITESAILNRPHPETKATPTQKKAAEERFEALPKIKKDARHPNFIFQKEGLLTEADKKVLKAARDASLEESKVRQVRPDETIVERSTYDGKDYVFSYSSSAYFGSSGSNGAGSYYLCPGDRVVVSTCDNYMYGTHSSISFSYFSDGGTTHYSSPPHQYSACTDASGINTGITVEFINNYAVCGYYYFQFDCTYNSNYGSYCGGLMTTKRFYEFSGGYEPYIYKPELNQWGDMCYDQSQYFCSSTSCLTPATPPPTNLSMGYVPWSWETYCHQYYYNGFGAACPQNATCSGGKYRCDAGFVDAFHLDSLSSDPTDCTACQKPRGCVPDTTVFGQPNVMKLNIPYNISHSYSNTMNFANVSLGNICGKNISIDGCTADQFGDQYIQLAPNTGYAPATNDDVYNWRICSRLKPEYSFTWMCNDAYLRLGCFGGGECGGTVEVTVGEGCPHGTYSPTGFTPCAPCPAGLTSNGTASTGCHKCAAGYIGFNGTAPCVACPPGTVEDRHMTCEVCNPTTLLTMSNNLYDKCLTQLLEKIVTLEQRVDSMVGAFEQYLEDTRFGMPTFHPTAMPTRRRRSRAPTV